MPPARLVDPVLKQTRTGDIAVLVAQFVRLTHPGRELFVISRSSTSITVDHILRIVIPDALQATDMTGRAQRRAADLRTRSAIASVAAKS